MQLETYSMGIGDRFGQQGAAQLQAMIRARREGVQVTPVWNKSHREHTTIGTRPEDVRAEADAATKALGWTHAYRVDADHIGLDNVDLFVEASDFFTLDVADAIGQPADTQAVEAFVRRCEPYIGTLEVPGLDEVLTVTVEDVKRIAGKFLFAVDRAARIYRRIAERKGGDNFITEVSMDETDEPQTPVEMFFILAAVADRGIPAQTVAPKFTGQFNKGIDYVGDVGQFAAEFNADLAVLARAVREFGLPENLKLSVHSGSDKFSIYPAIHEALQVHGAGLHLKTAGTTWLEELIGLALSGDEGLDLARDVYRQTLEHMDELCAPYAAVLDIREEQLPTPERVAAWDAEAFAAALRHNPGEERYDRNVRQVLHVGYKVAAQMGDRYLDAVRNAEAVIAEQVTANIFERHLRPIFLGR